MMKTELSEDSMNGVGCVRKREGGRERDKDREEDGGGRGEKKKEEKEKGGERKMRERKYLHDCNLIFFTFFMCAGLVNV